MPNGQKRQRKVAIFWPSGHLDRSPATINLAIALARQGFQVDIFAARNLTALEAKVEEPGVRILFVPGVLPNYREPVMWMTLRFSFWALPKIVRGRYFFILASGIRGLLAAAVISLVTGTPAAYQALELYPSWEAKSLGQRFHKFLERWANRRMKFSISQDEMRARMLAEDNRLPRESVVLLPVSPLGPAKRTKSNFIAEKFHLSPKNKIILYAGTLFADFSLAEELIAAAQTWPEEWSLVLHNSTIFPESDYQPWKALDTNQRVVFSIDPLPYHELAKLMSSADIGLAVYKRTDDNMYYMGLASGKLAEYLRYGVPVVASDIPGLRDLVQQRQIGRTANSVAEIRSAVEQILRDPVSYSQHCVECFNERLAQERFIPNVTAAMEEMQDT